jgi:hypothetical protein
LINPKLADDLLRLGLDLLSSHLAAEVGLPFFSEINSSTASLVGKSKRVNERFEIRKKVADGGSRH